MDYSPPGYSVHEIFFQARILEWVAISFSRGSSHGRDQTYILCIEGKLLTAEPPGKPQWLWYQPRKQIRNTQKVQYLPPLQNGSEVTSPWQPPRGCWAGEIPRGGDRGQRTRNSGHRCNQTLRFQPHVEPAVSWSSPGFSSLPLEEGVWDRPSGSFRRKWLGLPWWLSGKESARQCRRHRFNPWSGKIPQAWEKLSPCVTSTEPVL